MSQKWNARLIWVNTNLTSFRIMIFEIAHRMAILNNFLKMKNLDISQQKANSHVEQLPKIFKALKTRDMHRSIISCDNNKYCKWSVSLASCCKRWPCNRICFWTNESFQRYAVSRHEEINLWPLLPRLIFILRATSVLRDSPILYQYGYMTRESNPSPICLALATPKDPFFQREPL